MLHRWFLKSERNASAPDGERIYAVGDIHGRLDLLTALIGEVERDLPGGDVKPAIVFLGDYVDRGPDTAGVLDQLDRLRSFKIETVFLKGNHEAAMLDFMDDPQANEEWLHWGGDATLDSYGVTDYWRRDAEAIAADLKECLPTHHLTFLESLQMHHERGDYFFVHAGVRPGIPLDAQRPRDLMWIRQEFHNMPAAQRPDKTIVHGHHSVRTPIDAGWRIAVDTGAFSTGRLTAVVLEGQTRRFIST